MTIESKHYHPGFDDFEQFFAHMAGVTARQVEELAKLDNETGEFNRRRLAFWTNLWQRYLKITGRDNADI